MDSPSGLILAGAVAKFDDSMKPISLGLEQAELDHAPFDPDAGCRGGACGR